MGPFVADVPSPIRRFWPFFIQRTPKPRLPTVSDIIKAGDKGILTSAMFEWIPYNRHHVSWRPVYEACFEEWLWRKQAPFEHLENYDRRTRKYLDHIQETVAEKIWRKKTNIKWSLLSQVRVMPAV